MAQGEELNISIKTLSNSPKLNLFFDLKETVYVNSNWEMSNFNVVMFIANNLTILLVNSTVLVWLKIKENTLVDRMVLLDCFANISTIGVMFLAFPIRIWGNSYLCLLITFFRGFVLVLNRCLILSCLSSYPERKIIQDHLCDSCPLQSLDGVPCGILPSSRREGD